MNLFIEQKNQEPRVNKDWENLLTNTFHFHWELHCRIQA